MISLKSGAVRTLWCVACFLAAAAWSAGADTLFDQAPLDGGGAFLTGGPLGQLYFADDFGLASNTHLNSITWWGGFFGSSGTAFDIRIFDDAGGEPGTMLAAFTGAAPVAVDANMVGDLAFGWVPGLYVDVYAFTFDFTSPIELTAGQYYVSVYSTDADFAWLVSNAGNLNTWLSDTPNPNWVAHDYDGNLAFQLDGTPQQDPGIIPEPATLAALALGLTGLIVRDVRRRLSRT